MSISKENEYNTLRNEILNEIQMQTNLRVAMVTVSIAILSLTFDNGSPNLLLLNFAIIIMLRMLIHSKQFGTFKLSAYIVVRFERNSEDLKWESIASKCKLIGKDMILLNKIRIIGYYFASILGMITTILYISSLKSEANLCWFNVIIVVVCMMIILFLDFGFNYDKIRESYINEFEKILK